MTHTGYALLLTLVGAAIRIAAAGELTPQPAPALRIGGAPYTLVRIPAGEFVMGSERKSEQPPHRVRVGNFDLGVAEVTVREFRAFVEATGYRTEAEREGNAWACRWSADDSVSWRTRGYWATENGVNWRSPGFAQADDHPVVALSWQDAVEFCRWLSRQTGDDIRLPTEAEWEYAARAGDAAERPPDLGAMAWHKVNSNGATRPVRQKQPNAWGLFDMLGNAWEWVADIWFEDYTGAPTDGSARAGQGSGFGPIPAGDVRPLRGGGWCLETGESRYAARPGFGLHQRCNNSGFRIARSVKSAK